MLIPEENRKDLAEIPKNVKDKLDIRPVRWIDEVLEVALHINRHRCRGGPSRPSQDVKSKSQAEGQAVESSLTTAALKPAVSRYDRLSAGFLPGINCALIRLLDDGGTRHEKPCGSFDEHRFSNDIESRNLNMNKSELIDAVASGADLSKADATRAADAVLDSITETLGKGDQVTWWALVPLRYASAQPRAAVIRRPARPFRSRHPNHLASRLAKPSRMP